VYRRTLHAGKFTLFCSDGTLRMLKHIYTCTIHSLQQYSINTQQCTRWWTDGRHTCRNTRHPPAKFQPDTHDTCTWTPHACMQSELGRLSRLGRYRAMTVCTCCNLCFHLEQHRKWLLYFPRIDCRRTALHSSELSITQHISIQAISLYIYCCQPVRLMKMMNLSNLKCSDTTHAR
jgi:hypothetical protein